MDDKAYNDLKIRAVLMPESSRWPEPKFYQWQKLHQCSDEAFDRVARAHELLDAVDANPDLTPRQSQGAHEDRGEGGQRFSQEQYAGERAYRRVAAAGALERENR